MNVDSLIKTCSPENSNWIEGLMGTWCTEKVDFWPYLRSDIHTSRIVFISDENYYTEQSGFFDYLKGCLLITQNENRHRDFLDRGISSIYYPWVHWILHLIPLRRLGVFPEKFRTDTKIFNFLNRRWHPGRYKLIRYLMEESKDVCVQGFITANEFDYYKDHPEIASDAGFNSFYQEGSVGFEKNNVEFLGTECSVNVKNFFHIADNVPGLICLQVETAWPEHHYQIRLTEKSMIPFITQQIPLLIGPDPGLISLLRSQGFDTFDDLIDHSYDDKPDYGDRLLGSINLNRALLSGHRRIPDVSMRLKKNQDFLVNKWLDSNLLDLFDDINNFLEKEKICLQ